jgi:hypothetical protein
MDKYEMWERKSIEEFIQSQKGRTDQPTRAEMDRAIEYVGAFHEQLRDIEQDRINKIREREARQMRREGRITRACRPDGSISCGASGQRPSRSDGPPRA